MDHLSKPIVTPKLHRERDIWKDFAEKFLMEHPECWGKYSRSRRMKNFAIYKKEGTKVIEIMTFDTWKKFTCNYFIKAKDAIIQGRVFNIGGNLGLLYAKRIERNFSNKQINYHATNQRPKVVGEDGVSRPDRIIYHMEPWYCRVAWDKNKKIPNESVYKMEIAHGNSSGKGFKPEFIRAITTDTLLPFRYRYYPWRAKNEKAPPKPKNTKMARI